MRRDYGRTSIAYQWRGTPEASGPGRCGGEPIRGPSDPARKLLQKLAARASLVLHAS